jgi:uncharacterized protein YkwD
MIKILLLVMFFMVGCGTTRYVYPQSTIISHPYPVPRLSENEKYMYITAINRMRSQGRTCGNLGYFPAAPALRWNDFLYAAAYEHSADMAINNMFSHQGSGKSSDWTNRVQSLGRMSTFTDRIENNGYKQWKRLAQNIAGGMSTLDKTMKQWETSAHHCENIMNPLFTDFGLAHVYKKDTTLRHYWTQNFALHQ